MKSTCPKAWGNLRNWREITGQLEKLSEKYGETVGKPQGNVRKGIVITSFRGVISSEGRN
jgi:hypothetical protein